MPGVPGKVASAAPRAAGRRGKPRAGAFTDRDPIQADAGGEGEGWHALAADAALTRLASSPDGLDEGEARRRRAIHGANALDSGGEASRLAILARQFANLPTALLMGSSLASALLRELVDAAAIQAVVLLNAAIGYRIESSNADLIRSWKRLDAGRARVIRGQVQEVSAEDLVPGDILVCRAGEVVPADARVLDAHRLAVDESALTGESEPQQKRSDPAPPAAPLAERTSMLFAGTTLVAGRGRAVVVATGPGTEVARIRSLVQRTRQPPTTLERRIEDLGRKATAVSAAAGGVAAMAGLAQGRGAAAVLRSGVALGVAAMPEGLPLVVTASLVRATRRMRKHGMVVRRLGAIETLGGVTVVCADKTGTLTCNEMRLEVLEVAGAPVPLPFAGERSEDPFANPATAALVAAVLNSDLEVHNGNGVLNVLGSSTERAFVEAARQAGMDVESNRRRYPRRLLRERDERLHYVTSLHDAPGGGRVAFVKGAPEQVLSLCASEVGRPLDEGGRDRLLARNDALAADGLRVLALAVRELPPGADLPAGGFDLLGLAGLRDPLRASAPAALRHAAGARIRTLVLTGDQRPTAAAIARAAGLEGRAVEWSEIAEALREGRSGALDGISVVARVAPADKLRVVEALRRAGEVVAMAGDGINDAPALRAADVGIAVGAGATDVARETADVVLASDDLRAILAAIGEGRVVQDNLKRAVRYLAATNLSEIALVLGGSLLGVETVSPLQLLWVNLLTDTLPALALALEPGRPGVLDREPTPPGSPIVDRETWPWIGLDALGLAGVGAAAFALGGPAAVFGALPGSQLAYAWRCRAPGAPLSGRFLALVGGSAAFHAGVILLPPLAGVLGFPWAPGTALAGFAAGLAAGFLLPPSGAPSRAAPSGHPAVAATRPGGALADSIAGVLGRDAFVVPGRGLAARPASPGG